jgi:hypothetical protein
MRQEIKFWTCVQNMLQNILEASDIYLNRNTQNDIFPKGYSKHKRKNISMYLQMTDVLSHMPIFE